MKIKKYIIVPLLSLALLTGCSNETFDKAMEEGKIAVASKEYDKAQNLFGLAVEENKKDEEANKLYSQTQKLVEAEKLKEEGKIEKSVNLCNEISKIDSESDVVKKQVIELRKELKGLVENTDQLEIEIKEGIAKSEELMSNNKYEDAKKELEKLSQEIGDNKSFDTDLEKINELIKQCEEIMNKHKEETNTKSELASKRSVYLDKLDKIEYDLEELSYLYDSGVTANMSEAASKEHKRWDDALNEIYGVLKQYLPSDEMSKLKQKELNWISYRDKTAKEESLLNEGGTLEGLTYISVLGTLTKERCYELVENYMK